MKKFMPTNNSSRLESLLFISTKPLGVKKIAQTLEMGESEVSELLNELQKKYDAPDSGLNLINAGKEWQLTTAKAQSDFVREFLADDASGELSRPSLEALTIVAYRGPISKPEIEQLRGVNCSLILRNLMIRGLVEMVEGTDKLEPRYQTTTDFLKFLGIKNVRELPNFEKLNSADNLLKFLAEKAGICDKV